MLKKNSVIAMSICLLSAQSLPAFAQLGSSELITPGASEYAPSGSSGRMGSSELITPSHSGHSYIAGRPSAPQLGSSELIAPSHSNFVAPQMHLSGSVSQDSTMYGGNLSPEQAMSQLGLGGAAPQQQSMYMAPQMPMGGIGSQMPMGGMGSQMPMGGMGGTPDPMSILMAGMAGGGGNPLGDGLGQAMTAAATVGLLGSSAMGAVGDSLRGMGFSGGFRGRAMGANRNGPYNLSPFGGTGLGQRGPGTLGGGIGGGDVYTSPGGGGGSLGQTINRTLDRNIQYATDQATRRLIHEMWRR